MPDCQLRGRDGGSGRALRRPTRTEADFATHIDRTLATDPDAA